MENMDSHSTEKTESQPQQPNKGTTFLRTCINGLNALSGLSMNSNSVFGIFDSILSNWNSSKISSKFQRMELEFPTSLDMTKMFISTKMHKPVMILIIILAFSLTLLFYFLGVGILSIPYALSEGGWLCLLILFLVALLCFYTGLLLRRCMDSDPLIKTYPDIGELAFGSKGRAMVSTFMYLELYLVAVEFLILEGDNLHKLFPNVHFHIAGQNVGGKQAFVMLTALVILPTTWLRSLGLLAYVSAGGVLASVVLVCSVFWAGAFDGVGFEERGNVWNWSGLPTAISLYTFCYCGHAVFPTLCNSMKDRSQFPKVLLVCFILSTISYGSMAVLGYLMFGDNLTSQITLNLPTRNVSSKIAIYTTLINPITKYAIIVSPIATAIEETFPFRHSRPMSFLIRTALVISTVFVALVIPFFGYVMAFIGAFLSISVSMLFPCLCYLKINKSSRSFGWEMVIIMVILVMGSFVAVVGTYTSLREIVNHVQPK